MRNGGRAFLAISLVGIAVISGCGLLWAIASATPARHDGFRGRLGVSAPGSFRPYSPLADDDCYYAGDHEASDLCAQWRAALAAERSADAARTGDVLAAIAAFASSLGTALLVWTLMETRATTRRQLRAYVSSTLHMLKFDRATGDLSLRLEMNNTGPTPASEMCHRMQFSIRGRSGFAEDFPNLEPHPTASRSIIGSDKTRKSHRTFRVPAADLPDMLAGKSVLFIDGIISYRDVFDKDHATRFRVYFSKQNDFRTFVRTARGNAAT